MFSNRQNLIFPVVTRVESHLGTILNWINQAPINGSTSFTTHVKSCDPNFNWLVRAENQDPSSKIGKAELWKHFKIDCVQEVSPRRIGTPNCSLCRIERRWIYDGMRKGNLMNRNTDWLQKCMHDPAVLIRFDRNGNNMKGKIRKPKNDEARKRRIENFRCKTQIN